MKTFITAVIMTTAIALSGNVAMAAQVHTKTAAAAHAVTHKVQPRRVAVRRPAPAQQQVAFPGIFGALFGFPGAPAVSRGKADVGEYVPSMKSPTMTRPRQSTMAPGHRSRPPTRKRRHCSGYRSTSIR